MRVAIVCDWLVVYAGAERVLEQLLKIYPDADLFCLVDFLSEDQRGFIMNKSTHTSFIQHLPFAKKSYRSYLPLMPLAIEQLDVTGYDLVLSTSHAVAKGVITGPDQLHVSYVYSPIRYAWDLQHQYLSEIGLMHGLKSWIVRAILHYIRIWDYRTACGVDFFIADSKFIARRIKKIYGRTAEVIYPPVDVEKFTLVEEKENFYLTASRMVPYKKMKLIVEAFNEMPNRKLVVIGDGPEFARIKAVAKKNVQIMGYQPFEVLKDYMQRAKAFVLAAEEDFGITPIAAQECGTPVIPYGKGGSLETVRGCFEETHPTGVFFYSQTKEGIQEAVEFFEGSTYLGIDCRAHAEKFHPNIFQEKIYKAIQAAFLEK